MIATFMLQGGGALSTETNTGMYTQPMRLAAPVAEEQKCENHLQSVHFFYICIMVTFLLHVHSITVCNFVSIKLQLRGKKMLAY